MTLTAGSASGLWYSFESNYLKTCATDLYQILRIGSPTDVDDCVKLGCDRSKDVAMATSYVNPHNCGSRVAHTRLPSVGFRSWSRFLAVSLQVTSHKPGGRLLLLSARPAVAMATLKRAATNFAAWWTQARWMWTVCLGLLPDSVAAAISTQALLRLSPAR